jgi:4-diphosphocytidyl-2C-methyl-D-erythritol kinase
LLAEPLEAARARLVNDLEPAALADEPGLEAWRRLLDEHDAEHARLCGSGSSWFGMFADRARAEAALGTWCDAAKARDLGLRAAFVCAASGFGSRVVESK